MDFIIDYLNGTCQVSNVREFSTIKDSPSPLIQIQNRSTILNDRDSDYYLSSDTRDRSDFNSTRKKSLSNKSFPKEYLYCTGHGVNYFQMQKWKEDIILKSISNLGYDSLLPIGITKTKKELEVEEYQKSQSIEQDAVVHGYTDTRIDRESVGNTSHNVLFEGPLPTVDLDENIQSVTEDSYDYNDEYDRVDSDVEHSGLALDHPNIRRPIGVGLYMETSHIIESESQEQDYNQLHGSGDIEGHDEQEFMRMPSMCVSRIANDIDIRESRVPHLTMRLTDTVEEEMDID